MKGPTPQIGIFRRLLVVALCLMVALSASRLLLLAALWDRVAASGGTGFILVQGARFDGILVGLVLGPVAIVLPWLHVSAGLRRFRRWLVPAWAALAIGLAMFVEAATLPFIHEFDSRPNHLFTDYLWWPREVLATLTGAHLLELVVATCLGVLAAWLVWAWLRRDPAGTQPTSLSFSLLASLLAGLVTLLLVRSTLDHRPVNPSIAAFSQDTMVNQLPLNSPYSLLYSVYERNRDAKRASIGYGHMDDDEAMAIVLAEAGIGPGDQLDPGQPTLHHQRASRERTRPFNLVIILLESLGAEFVGRLGGEPGLTPTIDSLANEGIWFERLYATGTRSVRGIEAIVTGMTPTPGYSVVKRAETQVGFFTLAALLQQRGYHTSFVYGGEAHFDNMKRFFLNNGFAIVIDEKDYDDPIFYGSWGVSDEDLFRRAHQVFLDAGEGPFFSLVFTSSNHSPFDVPSGRVIPATGPDGARKTAVKYSDHALGRFLESAREARYWDDTVFLVVADHNSRNYGDALVPVERFRIPGVILGADIEPRRVRGVTSQIDLLPTLLSLIGVSSAHPAIGRDLTRPEFADGAGRAFLQFHALQAYLENNRLAVLQPDLEPGVFRLEADGSLVQQVEGDEELVRKALAHALWGPMTIERGAYRGERPAKFGSRNKDAERD